MSDKSLRDEGGEPGTNGRRRDFLVIGAQVAVGVGLLTAMWPFFAQLGPHRGSRRADITTVDLTSIPEGDTRLVSWRGEPVYVRHRSFAEIERARSAAVQERRDQLARNEALDPKLIASDDNRVLAGHARWLIVSGVCTHLNCLIHSRAPEDRMSDGIGWQCPCHASRYDLSGRVLDGPAPANLPVPPYTISGNRLEIGARRG